MGILLNNDIPSPNFSLELYKHSPQSNMLCPDRCMKFKTSKYHKKRDDIRLALGVT